MTFEEFIDEWSSGSDYITAQTSGSTGQPKRIKLEKEFVRRSALRTNSFFGITESSRLHSCISPDFIGGKMMAVRALEAGCRLTWEIPSNRPLAGMGKEERIYLLSVVPSQTLHILDNLADMPWIENMLVGGSAIDPSLRRKISASGIKAFESYGMTETASHIALRRITEEEGRFSTLGDIKVRNDDNGCLVIEFPTGERVETNDLATVFDDGTFLIDGRRDHVIITGGKKVNPYDVERRISHLVPGEFMISSEADEKWGRKVVLRIERGGLPHAEELDLSLLRFRLAQILQPWEVPKAIETVDALERTANGKLKR